MPDASKRIALSRRAQHLLQRVATLVACRAQTEQRLLTVLYPARLASVNRTDKFAIALGTEFEAWQRLDAEWLTRCFRWFQFLQWLPIVVIIGGLVITILSMSALDALGFATIEVTLTGVLLFLAAMIGAWYAVRMSRSAEALTNKESELRALIRLVWTTRKSWARKQDSVSDSLFQPYLNNPLGSWFVRETLGRLALISAREGGIEIE